MHKGQFEKTPEKNPGDRFIPNRTMNADALADVPASNPSPFNNYLCQSFLGLTPVEYNARRRLTFSSPVKKSPQISLSLFKRPDLITKSAYLKKRTSIESSTILDVPGFCDDFYSSLLSWSCVDRFFVPVETQEAGCYQIVSALAGNVNARKIVHLDPVSQIPGALAALEDNKVISGWEDGMLRLYNLDKSTAPCLNIMPSGYSKINAITVIDHQTCVTGNNHGNVSLVDFRTCPSSIEVTNDSARRISGLAYGGGYYLATGSNSNEVKLWDLRYLHGGAVHTFTHHNAGVKALAFNPGSEKYLISGGGAACCKLFMFNTHTGESIGSVNTGGQVTGVHWFRNDPRYIVTSHGFGSGPVVKLWSVSRQDFILDSEFRVSDRPDDRALHLAGSSTTNDFAVVTSSEALRFFKPVGLKSSLAEHTRSSVLPQMLSSGPVIR